jgi:hypothetical protein
MADEDYGPFAPQGLERGHKAGVTVLIEARAGLVKQQDLGAC